MNLKTIEQIASERNIPKSTLMKWCRGGMQCIRLKKMHSSDEWVDDYIVKLSSVKKEKVTKPKEKIIQIKRSNQIQRVF